MNSRELRVLFAPDWRDGVAYQQLLARSLLDQGVAVSFLAGYKRLLPLSRLCRAGKRNDLLHLHWPEAYYPLKGDGFDRFRSIRFALDLALTARQQPLVVTAHNLHAHNRANEWLAHWNYRAAFRQASAVIAHSVAARNLLIARFSLKSDRVHVIPHGDLSETLPPLPDRNEARSRLGLGTEPLCLMFGAVEPYKGIEEVLRFRREDTPPVSLAIVGKPIDATYGTEIAALANGVNNVHLQLRRLAESELCDWLAAADCVLFNYQAILTSGAASLTRSLGIPLLIPERCNAVDLGEPAERVIRFPRLDAGFSELLQRAVSVPRDYASASDWRASIAWARVAQLTASLYRTALAK